MNTPKRIPDFDARLSEADDESYGYGMLIGFSGEEQFEHRADDDLYDGDGRFY